MDSVWQERKSKALKFICFVGGPHCQDDLATCLVLNYTVYSTS